MKTCGTCIHARLPEQPKDKRRKVKGKEYGECGYPLPPVPMVASRSFISSAIWPTTDAEKCPCYQEK